MRKKGKNNPRPMPHTRCLTLKTTGKAAKILANMRTVSGGAVRASRAHGLLLLGGEGPERAALEPILPLVGYVVAADAGFDLALRLGLEPDLLVGDLDSVQHSEALVRFPAERIRRFPQAKDETDAEIGLRLLHEAGYAEVIIAGGGGGRLDHLLAVAALFERDNPPRAWYTAREHVALVDAELAVAGCHGQTVSLFPLGTGASGLSSEGLRWPLRGHWRRGQAGISNVVDGEGFRVGVRRGRLLMVRALGDEQHAGQD